MPRLSSILAALALVTACTLEPTEPIEPTLAIASGGGEGQTGTVGSTLPLPIVVQVTGTSGSTNDQILNYVVTSGGGSLFADVVLTGTPASGPFAKMSGIGQNRWTLGPAAGAQTVEARLIDPKTGATLTQAVFHATALAGNASRLTLSAGDRQQATAGTAVDTAPAVRVTDQAGNPSSGVPITFQVTSGGGSITGQAQVTTGPNGIAAIGGWTLGASAGPNTLTATRAGLVGSPLTFRATGLVGAATSLAALAGDGQHAPRGEQVATSPTVVVRDANGNGASGVAVTFTVTAGGGSMEGITSVTTLTDSQGQAKVSWSLGAPAGANRLRATALGLSGSPVDFDAVAFTPLYATSIDGSPSVTVHEAEAGGNAGFVRKIQGPNTLLDTPTMVVRDGAGQLYVTNYTADRITIYARGANGNASPVRTLSGPATGINRPYGLTRDADGNIYVANVGPSSITVYSPNASGNAAPLRTIAGPATGLVTPCGLRVDGSGQIFVGDNDGNSIRVFAAGAEGNAAPIRVIQGPNTGLSIPTSVEIDGGELYVTNAGNHSVRVFSAGADGDVAPVRVISGPSTGMSHPVGLARGDDGLLYVSNYFNSTITVFPLGADGDAAPVRTIGGSSTGLQGPNWVAF